ncbi:excinuclease ABC subunit UvrA [Flavobacteriales bacterium]|nr:excinuclease ABC subunit UvrA [Flavobacteriales bacterium]
MEENISIQGCKVHNLKNIDLKIPRNKLVVITGLSGSGKSSLAFDTIYAEAQRRYIETFSVYARQFVGELKRPNVDKIDGLSPVIAIEQKTTTKNPRSTVGTITEIYDYLRLLFARVSDAHSYVSGKKMVSYTDLEIFDLIKSKYFDKKIKILSPIIKSRKGHYRELFVSIKKQGFDKVRVDNEIIDIVDGFELDRYKIHTIEILIDNFTLRDDNNSDERLKNSLNITFSNGDGSVLIIDENNNLSYYSKNLICPDSGISYKLPEPNSFSFNSPYGMCNQCKGLGYVNEVNIDSLIPDKNKSIYSGGITAVGSYKNNWMFSQLKNISNKYKFDLKDPIKDIPKKALNIILYGGKEKFKIMSKSLGLTRTYSIDFEGIVSFINNQFSFSESKKLKSWARNFMLKSNCNECNGTRLRNESLNFKILDKNIFEVSNMSFINLVEWVSSLPKKLDSKKNKISSQIIIEILKRINFILDVGLDYLTLSRETRSLSGGESQRIRLATQIGSQLQDVLYILDEPSIGLHQIDNNKLIDSLKKLRDLGNTIIVVEHDKDIMLKSDYIIDIGPGAGKNGGNVVFSDLSSKITNSNTLTAKYLNGKKCIKRNIRHNLNLKKFIEITGCSGNNLKNIDVQIPVGLISGICGVSGSGKSTLINETLYPIFNNRIYNGNKVPLPFKKIKGSEYIDKVIQINQSPIGKTVRSNPATYTGIFNDIRQLFSNLPESVIRGYNPGRFSFNVKGGRCEECMGGGMKKIEMNFLPDVYVECDECNGRRFNSETLMVKLKGKSISEILNMTIKEAALIFENYPKIIRKLNTLIDVGLGYISLGQSSTTLSGGEAQRIKLATELSKKDTGKTLFIFDEPTTGLHFEDIKQLLSIIYRLSEKGNTILIIEHNIDILKIVDYIIELGPKGGENGGNVIFQGSFDDFIKNKKSITNLFVKKELNLEYAQQKMV